MLRLTWDLFTRWMKLSLAVALLILPAACGAPRAQAPAASVTPPPAPPSLPTASPAPAQPPTATRPSASPTAPATLALPTRAATVTAAPAATTRPVATVAATAVSPRGSAPVAGASLVTYEKSGGLKGVRDTLVVYDDGQVELSNRAGAKKTGQVSQDVVFTLQQRIGLVDWARLKPRYQVSGADMFTYTVTVTLPNGATTSVTTMDTAQHPDTLDAVLRSLEEIARQVQ